MNLFERLLAVMFIIFACGVSWGLWRSRQHPGRLREWFGRKPGLLAHKPMPQPGDYVPDEWVAEYQRQNRHPDGCKCRTCGQRHPRPGGAL